MGNFDKVFSQYIVELFIYFQINVILMDWGKQIASIFLTIVIFVLTYILIERLLHLLQLISKFVFVIFTYRYVVTYNIHTAILVL